MSKSKEELNALKEELKNVTEKLRELTPEELEQVTGGYPESGINTEIETTFKNGKTGKDFEFKVYEGKVQDTFDRTW